MVNSHYTYKLTYHQQQLLSSLYGAVVTALALAWDVFGTLRFVRLLVAAVSAVATTSVWPQACAVFPSLVPLGPG